MNNSKFKNLVFFALMFLIFFQLLTTFIESIYVLCLLKLELTNDLLWLLIFLSPLVSIALSKKHIVSRLNICVLVIVLSRVTMNFFNPDIKLIISGVGVGTFLVMLPYFFKWLAEAEILPLNTFIASGFALFFLTVFKSLGASFDVTENKYLGLVFLAVPILGFKLIDTSTKAISKTKTHSKITTASTLLGISAIFILLYFTFSSPVVMYRWSHLNSI